jgi:hydrogenase maturation protease
MKILVAGVGNVLRGDDAFGVEVVKLLEVRGTRSDDIHFFEAGISGISLVQELMNNYDALIIIDAVDRGGEAGTVYLLEPDIPALDENESLQFHYSLVDAHYADPSKALLLAKKLNVIPAKVFIIGCQPASCDELESDLTPAVKSAVPIAVERIEALIAALLGVDAIKTDESLERAE